FSPTMRPPPSSPLFPYTTLFRSATVRAAKLIVLGEVRGEVLGAARVEVCAGGRLFADVETERLVIQEGATFEGRSRMSAPETARSEEHTSELQSLTNIVCRLLLE